uniref:pyridoxal kinase n=1 Tax=Steinernema glaseri TaxID=37863 RepID=A0A1I8AQK0_9BILA
MFDSPEKEIMHCYASLQQDENTFVQHRFEIPVLQGRFVGTGDVFASLLIVWLHIYKNDVPKAVSSVISSIHSILKRTIKHAYGDKSPSEFTPTAAQAELQLVESRLELLAPSIPINYIKLP